MSMSNRGLVKAGRRVLVVLNGRLGSASMSMRDVTFFGPSYDSDDDAIAYGKAKFGKVAVPYVKPVEVVIPAPVPVPAPVMVVEEESKPLGVLPPPDDSKPKRLIDLTVPVLRGLCKANGLKGYSKLAKAGLIGVLTAAKIAA